MEHRFLGTSGFKVSALGFGTGTFAGKGPLFSAWGTTDVADARRLVDICLDAGVSFFDSADVYSDGAAETILGAAIKGRRDAVVLSTKVSLRAGEGANDVGSSKHHLLRAIDLALGRLGTDYIDLLQLHHFDSRTSVESVMSTLDDVVRAGKVRYVGVSNFSGWQIMKSLAVADRYGYARCVANQAYYSLIGRDYEWELMPLGLDQGIGAVVWSPLGWGNESQLRDNLGAIAWTLSSSQVAALDAASAVMPPYPYYPYWNGQFAERSPPPVASSLVSTLAGPTRNSP